MLFTRKAETDNHLAEIMEKVAWVIMAYNGLTLFPYFWNILNKSQQLQRIFGSTTAMLLILGIEAATLTVLFNPKVLLNVLDRPKTLMNHSDKTVQRINGLASISGIILFFTIAAYTFYFDYDINLQQMGGSKVFFLKVLSAVFVLGSEIAFGCANIFSTAGNEVSDRSGSMR